MDSKKFPTLSLSKDKLTCSKNGHAGMPFEFVCKKEDCKERLVCAECVLGDHSDHFPWMTVLEDFFNESLLKKSEEKISSLKSFIEKTYSFEKEFSEKISKEKSKVLEEIKNIKENILSKFTELETRVENEVESHLSNFFKEITSVRSLIQGDSADFPEKIEDTDTLMQYLKQAIAQDDEHREKKAKYHMEKIKDYITSVSLIQLDINHFKHFTSFINSHVSFNIELDLTELQKKTHCLPVSNHDIMTLNCRRVIETAHKKPIFKVLFLDLESKIATCSDDQTIQLYEFKSGSHIATLSGHTDRVWTIHQLRSGKLVSCSVDKTIRIWDLDKKICEKTLEGHSAFVTSLVELPNNKLMSGSHDKHIKIWDLKAEATHACKKNVSIQNCGKIMEIVFLADDMFACTSDNSILIVSYPDFAVKQTLAGHTALVRDLCYLYDKKILISASDDKCIRVWNIENYKILKTLSGHSQTVTRIIPYKSEVFASASDDGSIKLWDLESGNCIKSLIGHDGWVINMSVLLDGSLVSTGADRTIRFWSDNNT